VHRICPFGSSLVSSPGGSVLDLILGVYVKRRRFYIIFIHIRSIYALRALPPKKVCRTKRLYVPRDTDVVGLFNLRFKHLSMCCIYNKMQENLYNYDFITRILHQILFEWSNRTWYWWNMQQEYKWKSWNRFAEEAEWKKPLENYTYTER
jgi:hypothetical protein